MKRPNKTQRRELSDGILQWLFPEWWFSTQDKIGREMYKATKKANKRKEDN